MNICPIKLSHAYPLYISPSKLFHPGPRLQSTLRHGLPRDVFGIVFGSVLLKTYTEGRRMWGTKISHVVPRETAYAYDTAY